MAEHQENWLERASRQVLDAHDGEAVFDYRHCDLQHLLLYTIRVLGDSSPSLLRGNIP
jgi:CDP-diacylglycerol pyrophosphatase